MPTTREPTRPGVFPRAFPKPWRTARPTAGRLVLAACAAVFGGAWAWGPATSGTTFGPAFGGEAAAAPGPAHPFASWLPERALAVYEAADPRAERAGFEGTLFRRLADAPALAPFVADLAAARDAFARRIAADARVDPAFAADLVGAPVSWAILDLALKPDGAVEPAVAVRLQLPRPVDERALFEAVSNHVNQPALLEAARASGFNLPSLTRVETWNVGGADQAVLAVLGANSLCVAVRGPYVLVYRGAGPEPFQALLARARPAPAAPGAAGAAEPCLWQTPGFQAAWQGAGARPDGSFLYLNLRRAQAALTLLPGAVGASVWEALGLDSVQDFGLAGGYAHEGMRHTLYFHAPGPRTGLLSAFLPNPVAEQTVAKLPASGGGALAARMNLAGLYEELPPLLDGIARAAGRPDGAAGLAELAGKQTVLTVPVPELLAALGPDFSYLSGDDGGALRFENVDLARFEELVRRMERGGGAALRERVVMEQYRVRYFNRTRDGALPAAPSYCVLGVRPDDPRRGALLLATHPQAIVAQIAQAGGVGRFASDPDFARVAAGLGGGYDVFLYVDNRASLTRVYNRLLPVMNAWTDPETASRWLFPGRSPEARPRGAALPALYLWSNSPLLGADPGLLPPGSALAPELFGFGLGVHTDARGITVNAYSPLGLGGGLAWLADGLLLSNPAAVGVVAGTMLEKP